MSIRWIGSRLFRHGQTFVRGLCRREYNTTNNIGDAIKGGSSAQAGFGGGRQIVTPQTGFALRNVGVQVGVHARRILIDNVLSRVTNTLAADLRKKAARRLLYGESGTFLAFVGVSLASGTGILTKEEELEGVCWEIRHAVSKIKWKHHEVDSNVFENEPISLEDLTLGEPIGKGANAVVYTAKMNDQKSTQYSKIDTEQQVRPTNQSNSSSFEIIESEDSTQFVEMLPQIEPEFKTNDDLEFPLAVKMMFNYDIQSSAMAIIKGMYRETIPSRVCLGNSAEANNWEVELANQQRQLPAHPNIVAMFSVFTGNVPELVGAASMYPAALPRRINPNGFGRNMSLFLIMKRYSCTLDDYLRQLKLNDTINYRHSILLFAQLLEGVAHLVAHGVSHRDLKADNLLLDVLDATSPPQLVISDFGCCLTDRSGNLTLSYNSYEVYKGGNSALMAPEIMCAKPGTFSILNYGRSDLWASAAIAYELFGLPNPFYKVNASSTTNEVGGNGLRNDSYKMTDLPDLPKHVPKIVRALVSCCLERNPNRRLDPEIAANVVQLYLWAPSYWLKAGLTKLPSSTEILQWLLTLTTKVLCEGQRQSHQTLPVPVESSSSTSHAHIAANAAKVIYKNGRRTYPEYLLISTFLCRARLYKIKSALKFIQDCLNEK